MAPRGRESVPRSSARARTSWAIIGFGCRPDFIEAWVTLERFSLSVRLARGNIWPYARSCPFSQGGQRLLAKAGDARGLKGPERDLGLDILDV